MSEQDRVAGLVKSAFAVADKLEGEGGEVNLEKILWIIHLL